MLQINSTWKCKTNGERLENERKINKYNKKSMY